MLHLAEISLEAAIVAVTDNTPRLLTVDSGRVPQLPAGLLEGDDDPTLELALRRWITDQTGIQVGYVEQLYTFGDLHRSRSDGGTDRRQIGVAYLALIREAQPQSGATWLDWYELFPWEDHRKGRPDILDDIVSLLDDWADDDERRERARIAFGLDETPWDAVKVLERYELLYAARLVDEWGLDHPAEPARAGFGSPMVGDHRRVAATALGRLRGKLTYRPVVFELLADEFTLAQLQQVVEALLGANLHMQNFRRLVKQQGLVEKAGGIAPTGGRPAALYRFRREVLVERPVPGLWRR